jgi:hypothetical protein
VLLKGFAETMISGFEKQEKEYYRQRALRETKINSVEILREKDGR